jgi:hypothetical protein
MNALPFLTSSTDKHDRTADDTGPSLHEDFGYGTDEFGVPLPSVQHRHHHRNARLAPRRQFGPDLIEGSYQSYRLDHPKRDTGRGAFAVPLIPELLDRGALGFEADAG